MTDRIDAWLGVFGDLAPRDYFEDDDQEPENDRPLNRFVGEQGQNWIDHDWMEHIWQEDRVPVATLVNRLSCGSECRNELTSAAKRIGLGAANVFVRIDCGQIKAPRSVHHETFTLHYLGAFENVFEPLSIEQLTRDAEAGSAKAQATLGSLYLFPPPARGYEVNPEKAEHWLLKAADQGETSPYNRLYHIYYSKSDSLHDLEKAFFWIEKAAQLGGATDQHYLARMYERGEGVAQSKIHAVMWHLLKCCQYEHSSKADQALKKLSSQMSDEELRQSEQLAIGWIEVSGNDSKAFRGVKRDPRSWQDWESEPA